MTKTIKIGIDYDEPMFPWYDYAHDVSLAAGLADPDGEPPTDWDPTTTYGCALDDWYEVLNTEVLKGADGMYGRPYKPGVVDRIRQMYSLGYEIHIVTARGQFGIHGENIKRLTTSQLIREGVPYTSLRFTSDKYAVIKELGLDYFLDDRPVYYMDAKAAGAKAFLLDERWNRDFEVPEGDRVYSTQEYLDNILNVHGDLSRLLDSQKAHVRNALR